MRKKQTQDSDAAIFLFLAAIALLIIVSVGIAHMFGEPDATPWLIGLSVLCAFGLASKTRQRKYRNERYHDPRRW